MEIKYTVTAAVTTCKREWEKIERAIQSILVQTYPVYEILLIDDNDPSDGFSEIIRRKIEEYPMVRYVPMGKNSGVSKARNKAFEEGTGEFLAYLDDDDEWCPDKIESQIRMFEEDPELAMVYGVGIEKDDETGESDYNWQFYHFNGDPSYDDILENDYIGPPQVLVRMNVIRNLKGFLTDGQPAYEDYELWIRIIRYYKVRGTKKIMYIRHMDSGDHVSTNRKRSFIGIKNIYLINKRDYDECPASKLQILWNICREGIKAMDIRVAPYVFKWFCTKCRCVICG